MLRRARAIPTFCCLLPDGAAHAGPPGFDGVREKNLAISTTRDRSREAVMHAVQFSRIVDNRGRGRPFDPINTFAASG